MQDSVGKTVARTIFYQECLPSWLSAITLRSGNYLQLLGEEPHDLEHTDALGLSRDRVWSVERREHVYHRQVEQNLGVSLHHGEMNDFLRYQLHGNQLFQVLNLDIEGSFQSQLDTSLTSVLLFAWRNPSTVIGSYSSIGRDTEMIWEGIKSLLVFMWLAPDTITSFVQAWCERYRRAGFEQPIRMVVRDLFWLRSHLEHNLAVTEIAQLNKTGTLRLFAKLSSRLWEEVATNRTVPLTWEMCLNAANNVRRESAFQETAINQRFSLALEIQAIRHILYRGHPPWSQRCYFTRFASVKPIEMSTWVRAMLAMFTRSPLTFVDREGHRSDFQNEQNSGDSADFSEIWARADLYDSFKPRTIEVPAGLVPRQVLRTIKLIREREAQAAEEDTMAQCFVRNGQLTTTGLAEVRRLANKRELTATEIAEKFGGKIGLRIIAAHVAVARRADGGRQYLRGGKLTAHGREQLRALVEKGFDTAKIQTLVPATVSKRIIAGYVGSLKRQ